MDNNNKGLIDKIVEISKVYFSENLKSIIISGSFSNYSQKNSWSDLDILLVLERLSFNNFKMSSELLLELGKTIGLPIGVDIISSKEATAPITPFSLHSKAIQTLYEASLFPSRVIYKETGFSLSVPGNDVVREMSNQTVPFFYHDLRKILVRKTVNDPSELKETLRIVVRRLFNMVKMAVQYITLTPSQSRRETITLFENIFPEIESNILKELDDVISRWESIRNINELYKSLDSVFAFSETFYSTYQTKKIQLVEKFK